jgi:hypothetical protein
MKSVGRQKFIVLRSSKLLCNPVWEIDAIADDPTSDKKKEVHQALNQKYPDGNVLIDSSALVIYGEKSDRQVDLS